MACLGGLLLAPWWLPAASGGSWWLPGGRDQRGTQAACLQQLSRIHVLGIWRAENARVCHILRTGICSLFRGGFVLIVVVMGSLGLENDLLLQGT